VPLGDHVALDRHDAGRETAVAITEDERFRLHQGLVEVLGTERAATMTPSERRR